MNAATVPFKGTGAGVSGMDRVAGDSRVSGEARTHGGTARSSNVKRLEARLRGLAGKAIVDYRMIEDGDRVMACVSGGKDSHVMAHMLIAPARSAPVGFEVVAVNLDQRQPGFPRQRIKAMLAGWERESPGRSARILRAIQHVGPSHLADRKLFDFESLRGR